ncbi:hypothetical protein MASR2M78_05840 [Treponema sp.]|jgi:C4-dicarboxylate-specific signal transduction histidine kinase
MQYNGLLTFASRREDDMLVFSLTDSGPGITIDAQSRIFEPFFSTKLHGEGLGLGLELSKRIVEGFGGSISFESVPGKTSFYVRLKAVVE